MEELTQFLLSATPPQNSPLPIIPSAANRQRVDPEQSIETTGIYPDRWERRVRPIRRGDRRTKDVEDTFNYLSRQDWKEAQRRGFSEMDKKEKEYILAKYRLRREAEAQAEREGAELAGPLQAWHVADFLRIPDAFSWLSSMSGIVVPLGKSRFKIKAALCPGLETFFPGSTGSSTGT